MRILQSILLSALAYLGLSLPIHAKTVEVQQVTKGVWAVVGPFEQRNAENLGNNATFGVIETSAGTILIDPGGSAKGAAALDSVIGTLTDQPVTTVINTGGQDHRWLGNGYWRAKGVQIIASEEAVDDQAERASMQLTMLSALIGDEGLEGTEPAYADVIFEKEHSFELGGVAVKIYHSGAAHTPGDSYVWLPASNTVFTGDIVYVGRLIGVMGFSDSASWLEAFDAIAALKPEHLVPGHGPATTLAIARADTYDYLTNLRNQIHDHIDNGGDIIGSVQVEQAKFERLELFDSLARRNAQAVFEQMEWE